MVHDPDEFGAVSGLTDTVKRHEEKLKQWENDWGTVKAHMLNSVQEIGGHNHWGYGYQPMTYWAGTSATTSSVIPLSVSFGYGSAQPILPSQPKEETALDWLRRRVDEIRVPLAIAA